MAGFWPDHLDCGLGHTETLGNGMPTDICALKRELCSCQVSDSPCSLNLRYDLPGDLTYILLAEPGLSRNTYTSIFVVCFSVTRGITEIGNVSSIYNVWVKWLPVHQGCRGAAPLIHAPGP